MLSTSARAVGGIDVASLGLGVVRIEGFCSLRHREPNWNRNRIKNPIVNLKNQGASEKIPQMLTAAGTSPSSVITFQGSPVRPLL